MLYLTVHFLIGLHLQVLHIFLFLPNHMHRTVHKNTICICDSTLFTIYQLRWHNIPEDLHHHAHRCQKLKPCNKWDDYKNRTSGSISLISNFSTIFHSPMVSHVKNKMPATKQGAGHKMFLSNTYEEASITLRSAIPVV